jgi:hypothetical protein
MDPFAKPADAREAISKFLIYNGTALGPDLLAKVLTESSKPSVVDAVVGVTELLYANRATMNEDGRSLVGCLAAFAAQNGWHGMGGDENRGGLIAQAMKRDNGESRPGGGRWASAESDPAPLRRYLDIPEPTPEP